MSVVARPLDDLDRLAFRLSRIIRTQYPQLLTQGFTLSDLEERLLPYHDVRREMAQSGAGAFETALLRLVAGDRGYLRTDPELQAACREALAFPSPTLALVRSWASSTRLVTNVGHPTASGGTALVDAGLVDEHDLFPAPSQGVPAAPSPSAAPAKRVRSCCRYCDNTLPEGRKVTFCPHCGLDLTKRQCPACSTELEAHWKFCVTCGRHG
ncbi:MAG: zinc ribbon domain-containing protein [Gemmatimonas sp.]